ncbi:multiple sugar transport system substrate-binding protein [Peribacillus deserti]|uniref:Multiple sugar transport system substrate-binding protein n=1 Tax=Peribacillus deserti TaxID=673318 RepID=A0ABS2QES8_9BACI|nr:ABC transporter substrate-binding protein [Peribacillus deserti]MBM7691655.1 multiple sugar transport system substrate-binding protein [Peribacillus deserti]
MKKAFSLLLMMLLVVSLFLTGCSGNKASNGASGGGGKNFTYWYPWGGDSEKWDKWRMAEFEKDNKGYKIKATYVPPDGGISNGKLLASITGGNPPDVVISNEYATAYSLAVQGALTPLDDLLKKNKFDDSGVLESFKPLMKYKDKTYLFPQDSNVNLLYYNVKMFKEAGLDPDNPPKTIEELDAAAEKLTKVNNNKIDRLGFIPWLDAGDESYLWGWVFGANFYDPEKNKVELNDPKLQAAYKWMDTYAVKYNPEKIKTFTSGFGGAFSPDHPFFTGKVAMTLNGNWFANAIKIYSPNTEYRVAPIPTPEGGREKATTLGTNVFMIPKGAKNPDAAMKFILAGVQPKVLADNINTWRSISIFKEPSDAIKWDKENDQVYQVVREVSSSPGAGHPALTSVSKEMSNELKLLRDSVIYNHKDPAPLLKAAEDKLQKQADKTK